MKGDPTMVNKILVSALRTGIGLATTAAVSVGLDKMIPTEDTMPKIEKALVNVGKVLLGLTIVGTVTTVLSETRKKD